MTTAEMEATAPFPAPSRRDALAAGGAVADAFGWVFRNKDRTFWILQVTGWVGFFFLHIFTVSTLVGAGSRKSIVYSIAMSVIGFVATSYALRYVFRFARRLRPFGLLAVTIGSTTAMAFAMSLVKAQVFGLIFGYDWLQSRMDILGTDNFFIIIVPDLPANLFLLMSWAGFYFGVNYYLTLRNETERALLSARLADQAQLKMLRYQLNPHFLFNTLNAISTLVLEKDTKGANGMLTRLSAFLRYSLDSDPLQKTTLAEEVKALQLYLDIEKTRFGSRLAVDLKVTDEAREGLVPSLILQPAIENAIKYAIALMEGDGKITIEARREGDVLILRVCDNGPNAPKDPQALLLAGGGGGVGLVNMRDRLAHLYGERQSFTLSRLEPSGLCVTMKLPFEARSM
ncbi:MAG: histidine kinase [Parvularculaceae bacterium]|nr:histidine kinase [Parvularculaceae bacterium]